MTSLPGACPFCLSPRWTDSFAYSAPPPGETPFPLAQPYSRRYCRCEGCGHLWLLSSMDITRLYDSAYVTATYGGVEDMAAQFQRIIRLPPGRSDNEGRVRRVSEWAAAFLHPGRRRLLDVGSGLGVFPWRMAREGWDCTALDTDPRQVEHLRSLGLRAVLGDFHAAEDAGRYDIVSLNKVLEHVPAPVAMLAKAAARLAPGGLVYVELPDAEEAAAEGPGREEFFIEHLHVFSLASCALLLRRAGFSALAVERLREPSGKFTLRALGRARTDSNHERDVIHAS